MRISGFTAVINSVPDAPTIGTATATSSTTATVTYTAPAYNGNKTIASYTAVSSPGSITGTLSQSGSGTITVTGLTPGTGYTFTVYATNIIGNSNNSSASNSITPPANPVNTVAPSISNTSPAIGDYVTVNYGTWTGSPTSYTYQWQRDNSTNIVGATSSGYSIVSADYGHTINCRVTATNAYGGTTANSNSSSGVVQAPGSALYNTPGSYTFVVPVGVNFISVVCVGAGAAIGGGGALAYVNSIYVTPGTSYSVVVGGSTGIYGDGGNSTFDGTTVGAGGGGGYYSSGHGGYVLNGSGGNGGTGSVSGSGGGGGAGGYTGAGGAGGETSQNGSAGSGGGGGGGAGTYAYGGGGGVNVYGQGASGAGGTQTGDGVQYEGGGGGSGGQQGGGISNYSTFNNGGLYGGGAGGLNQGQTAQGTGVVRIIWPGNTRYFPSTDCSSP